MTGTQMEALSTALKSEEGDRDKVGVFTFALKRCVGNDIFIEAPKWDNPLGAAGPYETFRTQFYRAVGMIAADRLAYLQKMRRLIEAYRKPYPERLAATQAVMASVQRLPRVRELTAILFPDAVQYCDEEGKAIAVLRAAQVGLAVEKYRAAKGRLPATLNELVPAYLESVPPDPFDGKPLRFRELSDGFVVYSIGPDGKDNAGAERLPSLPPGAEYDVTFIVER